MIDSLPSIEQRLAAAQAEGLEPNVRRWLAFLGVAAVSVEIVVGIA